MTQKLSLKLYFYVYNAEVEDNFLPKNLFSGVVSFCWMSSDLFTEVQLFHYTGSVLLW